MLSEEPKRSEITFGQAEGVDPLPTQLSLREVSRRMRVLLWEIFDLYLTDSVDHGKYNAKHGDYGLKSEWRSIMLTWHVDFMEKMSDEFIDSVSYQKSLVKDIMVRGNYIEILNFVEFAVRTAKIPRIADFLNAALQRSLAAYRIVDKSVIAVVSDQEGEAVMTALETSSSSKFSAARGYLISAGRALAAEKWADCIRDSIHAVESAARSIDPSSNTLGDALKTLEKTGHIHSALSAGFLKIYGYTNAEQGLRHPLINEPEAKVGETEALYMYGACASFLTYLIRKDTGIN